MPLTVTVPASPGAPQKWLAKGERSRRSLLALGLYLAVTVTLLACAAPRTLTAHTPFNHFALLASSWLEGRLDLGGAPPSYTGNNDFAFAFDKWFVVFPPFPSALLLPMVALAGGPEAVCDGRFFLMLAGVAPAVVFLVLEKLSRLGESKRSEAENLTLAVLFCFGSVYFFSAVQGTVWYAAHVVGAGLMALYLLFALSAERPLLAGVCLGLGFATRTPLLFAAPLFFFEAFRSARRGAALGPGLVQRYDMRKLLRCVGLFCLPLALILTLTFWHNEARFGDPFEVGYRYLSVVWSKRITKWGLFDYHYLARNLGVMLASLPWIPASGSAPGTLQVNGHGLALWLTTPMYAWLLFPRRVTPLMRGLFLAAALVALPTLFYQNTGWVQFGYRFSNDYSVLLFVLLALGGPPLRGTFVVVSAFAVTLNFFGALTFGRPEHARFYFIENTQRVLFQPD